MKVQVYRNLNKPNMFSIRHKGKVIGHASTVTLIDCKFHVNPKAQAKIAAGGHRSVHAWVTGTIVGASTDIETATEVTYKPHQRPSFFKTSDNIAVTTAERATLTNNKIFCKGLN